VKIFVVFLIIYLCQISIALNIHRYPTLSSKVNGLNSQLPIIFNSRYSNNFRLKCLTNNDTNNIERKKFSISNSIRKIISITLTLCSLIFARPSLSLAKSSTKSGVSAIVSNSKNQKKGIVDSKKVQKPPTIATTSKVGASKKQGLQSQSSQLDYTNDDDQLKTKLTYLGVGFAIVSIVTAILSDDTESNKKKMSRVRKIQYIPKDGMYMFTSFCFMFYICFLIFRFR
jgi:hypothetical protein